jgi:hypothetical protein
MNKVENTKESKKKGRQREKENPKKTKIKQRGRGKRTKISKRLQRKLQNNTLNINSLAVPAKP